MLTLVNFEKEHPVYLHFLLYAFTSFQSSHHGHHGLPVVKVVDLVKKPGTANVKVLMAHLLNLKIIHVETQCVSKEKYVIPKSAQFILNGRSGANALCPAMEENSREKGLVCCHQYQVKTLPTYLM